MITLALRLLGRARDPPGRARVARRPGADRVSTGAIAARRRDRTSMATVGVDNAFHIGLVLTAFGFGFRHGIDWDHIAALTDITSSQEAPWRSMWFATLYALGHALVVFVLGFAAIVLAERIPDGVDAVMERFVGATLVILGCYVFYALVRHRSRFPDAESLDAAAQRSATRPRLDPKPAGSDQRVGRDRARPRSPADDPHDSSISTSTGTARASRSVGTALGASRSTTAGTAMSLRCPMIPSRTTCREPPSASACSTASARRHLPRCSSS